MLLLLLLDDGIALSILQRGGRARWVQVLVDFTICHFLFTFFDSISVHGYSGLGHHAILVELIRDFNALFIGLVVSHHTNLFLHHKDALGANLNSLPLVSSLL